MGTTISISMALMAANPLAGEASLVKQLTGGNWDVAEIVGVNQVAGTVYYLSNEGDPRQQQIWVVGLKWKRQTPGERFRRMARAGFLAQHQLLCGRHFLHHDATGHGYVPPPDRMPDDLEGSAARRRT